MTGTLNIISRQAKALYDIPPPWKYATSASVLPDCLDAVGYVSGSYTSRILSHSEQKCQCDGESFLFFLIPHRRRMQRFIAGWGRRRMALHRPVAGFADAVVNLPARYFVVFENPARDLGYLFGLGPRHHGHAVAVSYDDVAWHHQDVANHDGLIVGLYPHPALVDAAGREHGVLVHGDARENHLVGIAAHLVAHEASQSPAKQGEAHVGAADSVIDGLVIDHQDGSRLHQRVVAAPSAGALGAKLRRRAPALGLPRAFRRVRGEFWRRLLRWNEAQGQGHAVNAVAELLLVPPERPDVPVHHGHALQAHHVQGVNRVGNTDSVPQLEDPVVLLGWVLLGFQVLPGIRRRLAGLPPGQGCTAHRSEEHTSELPSRFGKTRMPSSA